MENSTMTTSQLIADSYVSYHSQVYLYILRKVNCQKEAEDLSQDVFLRLMELRGEKRCVSKFGRSENI